MFYNHEKPYYQDDEKQLKLDYVFNCDICNKFYKADDLKPEKFTVNYNFYMISHWFETCSNCTKNKRNLMITIGNDNKIKSIENLNVDLDKLDKLAESNDIDGMIGFLRERFAK
jgi:hypothetical protein